MTVAREDRSLFLIRHGHVYNPQHLVYGRLQGFPLSSAGEREAEYTAATLSQFPIRAVVSSPLERAVQTAAVIARSHRRPVVQDDRLAEVRNALQGRPYVPSHRSLPGVIELGAPLPFPGALESVDEIGLRAGSATAAALRSASGDVVVVSHQVPIMVLSRRIGITEKIVPDIHEGAVVCVRFVDGDWSAGLLGQRLASIDLQGGSDGLIRRLTSER